MVLVNVSSPTVDENSSVPLSLAATSRTSMDPSCDARYAIEWRFLDAAVLSSCAPSAGSIYGSGSTLICQTRN